MENQTLKIEIPEGYQVDSSNQDLGVIKLKKKPKEVTERIKTIDDILEDNNITKVDAENRKNDFIEMGLEHLYWQWIAELLAKSINEGWKPDWSNSNECKYFPWFEMKSSSGFRFCDYGRWFAASTVGSRLCFKSRKLAEYAGKQFTDLYEQFMTIK